MMKQFFISHLKHNSSSIQILIFLYASQNQYLLFAILNDRTQISDQQHKFPISSINICFQQNQLKSSSLSISLILKVLMTYKIFLTLSPVSNNFLVYSHLLKSFSSCKPMIQKQKQRQSQLKENIKEKAKQKASKIVYHLSKPLPAQKNKTSTQNPSYVSKQKESYLDIKSNLHLIINKASFMALRKQIKTATFKATEFQEKQKSSSINPKDVINNVVGKQPPELNIIRVMGCLPNENNVSQLWALVPNETHYLAFYIYHVESNMALKVEDDKVILAAKQKSKEFMFELINDTDKNKEHSIYKDSLVIKSLSSGKCLDLRGVLSLADLNIKDDHQHFYLKRIGFYQPNKLRNTYILFNPQDKDKQKASLSVSKQKQQICYQKLNYSLYQRWIFSPSIPNLDRSPSEEIKVNKVNKIKENDSIKNDSKHSSQMQKKSKLQAFGGAEIALITDAAKNLLVEYDNECCEIINFKVEKSLIVREEKGSYELVLVPQCQKRQWRIECDGFSMKIKHDKIGEYLGIIDDQVVLSKNPQYWQVLQSTNCSNDEKREVESRKQSMEQKSHSLEKSFNKKEK